MKDRNPENRSKLLNRRMFILSIAKVVVFGGIITRLFSLQVTQNKKYTGLSERNRLREWKLAPQRGIIKDFYDNVIAENSQTYQLHMVPEDVPNLNLVFFRLRNLINLSDSSIEKITKKIRKQKPWQPIIISDNLSWSQFSRLNIYLHELQGIETVVSLAREYAHNESFSHVIGYVAPVSNNELISSKDLRELYVPGLKIGKVGLEKALNFKLIGKPGFQRYEVNAFGKRVKEIKIVEGKFGKNFKTTFDSEIQNFIYDLIKDKSGSVCVMDIYTGEVIAMVSSPSFNPNSFVHGISNYEWNTLLQNEKKPLINKSISGLYSPGSVIKPLVALSALENDVISPKLVVQCKGSVELHGHTYHCWKKKGHGFVSLRNAIKQSCDIYFYEIARRLGVDRLSITAKKFGLGKNLLNSLVEEKKGIVPSTMWKRKTLGQSWLLGETLITGIGQGYIQTTPLQLCLMQAQLANGGFKIEPKILATKNAVNLKKQISIWEENNLSKNTNQNNQEKGLQNLGLVDFIGTENKPKILFRNQENIKFVNEALFGATNEVMGTAYSSRHSKKKYIYAGKTGTAQVKIFTDEQREKKLKNKDRPYKDRDHALFTAFAPYKDPNYAISIVIEHGGSGSSTAAPIAKKIVKILIDRHKDRQLYKTQSIKEI